jgi:hypothetical protein
MKSYSKKKRLIKFINWWNRSKLLPGKINLRNILQVRKQEITESVVKDIMFAIYSTPPTDIEKLRPVIRQKLHGHAHYYILKGFEIYKKAANDLQHNLIADLFDID